MKFLIALALLITVAAAQRPTYAGLSAKGYPELASRFRDPADDQEQNTANSIVNRFGEDGQNAQNLPTDARGDGILVNRLNQWPRENRPFWLINAEHVEKQRRPNENTNQQQEIRNTIQQQGIQQRFNNEPELNLRRDPLLAERSQQTFSNNQQVDLGSQPVSQSGQLEPRFGESRGTEIRTIKPVVQRGSFAGLGTSY